jgi:class 3 adenylate cyclase
MVTFVFTNIEGSTRLFRRIGDRYVGLLERHHALLQDAWLTYGGVEVNTEGDAFFVAFADVGDAIEACASAQRSLVSEPWPPDAGLRVRMGVHTGLAYPRDGDFIAFAVHQAARVANAGNGDQILGLGHSAERVSNLHEVELSLLVRFQVRCCRQVVEHDLTGLLVDIAAVSDALDDVVSDAERSTRMGSAATAKARRDFDESDVVNRVLACYSEVAARKGVELTIDRSRVVS